jgi:hypothetical protein
MTVTVPPDRNVGDAGHVNDHNLIADDLTSLSDAVDDLNDRVQSGKITVADVAPTSPAEGDLWFDTSGAM